MKGKDRPHKNGRETQESKGIQKVVLPYHFVPFAKDYHVAYSQEELPKHDGSGKGKLSGCITYEIKPQSDLSVELRSTLDSHLFMSGSVLRGKSRVNAMILSASYPEFIDQTALLYRDITRSISAQTAKYYHEQLLGNGNKLEEAVQAGFLQKNDEGQFYVVPAKKFGKKNFISIKEHKLLNMNPGFTKLFKWSKKDLSKLNNLQNEIDRLDLLIKENRQLYKTKITDEIDKQISNEFLNSFAFNKQLKRLKKMNGQECEQKLTEIKKKLISSLKSNIKDGELNQLIDLMADRWFKKAKMHLFYQKLARYSSFTPYQIKIYYKENVHHSIESIMQTSGQNGLTAYLFNSTDARSKRSHYVVRPPVQKNEEGYEEYLVPQSLTEVYKKMLKRSRFSGENVKKFYDIFEKYDEIVNKGNEKNFSYDNYKEGIIVFYKLDENKNIQYIGRTPYFKIPYKNQIKDILDHPQISGEVDYVKALFGYISEDIQIDEKESEQSIRSYKSRLRFSPIDIDGVTDAHKQKFLLPTPSATANVMYIKQDGTEIKTYNDDNIELNGYKYYHVLPKSLQETVPDIENNKRNVSEKMITERKIVRVSDSSDSLVMKGKIYFRYLTEEELGLLLISTDLSLLKHSSVIREELDNDDLKKLEHVYELIGGAKPYGYGKVMVRVQEVMIEKTGTSFNDLVLEPFKIYQRDAEEFGKWIDAFINKIREKHHKTSYADLVHLKEYIESKLEIDVQAGEEAVQHVNWININILNKDGVGYNKNWRLARPPIKD